MTNSTTAEEGETTLGEFEPMGSTNPFPPFLTAQ
jgi:hypothetical protein